MTDETFEEPGEPIRELERDQRRVLGVLVEKAMTTPEYYPMTLKAITAGCNQRSNRHPLVNYSETTVLDALEALAELRLAAVVHTESGRTERYRHYMRHRFDLTEPQLAILTELLLRGRQQLGELRSRANRMRPIENQAVLRAELAGLVESGLVQASGPLERRGVEVDHALYTASEAQYRQLNSTAEPQPAAQTPPVRSDPTSAVSTPSTTASNSASGTSQPAAASAATEQLELTVAAQAERIRELTEQLDQLQSTVAELGDAVDDLKRQLGV